jgi:hypothetical protein
MTYQFPQDSSIDNLLKMTNDVMMKIKSHSQEIYQ